jgi:hypothetical protein
LRSSASRNFRFASSSAPFGSGLAAVMPTSLGWFDLGWRWIDD